MKRIYFSLLRCLISICFFSAVQAQKRGKDINSSDIRIEWKVLENNFQGKGEAISVLNIIPEGSNSLGQSGWKIYFNFGRTVVPSIEGQGLNVRHVNGGLYYIYPLPGFEAPAKGGKATFTFLSGSWFVNESDAPHGFYLVRDAMPEEYQVISNVKVLPPDDPQNLVRFAGDKVFSASDLFKRNAKYANEGSAGSVPLFPAPLKFEKKEGQVNILAFQGIVYAPSFKASADVLSQDLFLLSAKRIPVADNKGGKKPQIYLLKDTLKSEAYKLSVSADRIEIRAADNAGIFYGIQSLKTLIEPGKPGIKMKELKVPACDVYDAPRFGFRAFMLDVARNFQPKKEVLKVIDLLALYKLNRLHFHLNDDEGWRLEIPGLPELVETGGRRGHGLTEKNQLMPAYGSGPDRDMAPGSGHYSREDFIEILQYAHARHIMVIPEIETPGHARAAIKAMAARRSRLLAIGDSIGATKYVLNSEGDESEYRSVQKWNDNVMDVSLPSVYNFLSHVTDEIIGMYKEAGSPLETIHFGGDEVPLGVWERSPAYASLKKERPELKDTEDLWDYFFKRLNSMLKEKGLFLSGWEETGLRKTALGGKKRWIPNPLFVNEGFRVNVWNNMSGNEDLAYRLANAGYKVVLSFVTNFYFDMAYQNHFKDPGFNWGGFIDMEKPFRFKPFDYLSNVKTDYLEKPLHKDIINRSEKLTEYGKQNIAGIQGLVWSETVKNPERLEYMLLPRLLALAQKAWSPIPQWEEEADTVLSRKYFNQDFSAFLYASGREMKRLDTYSGGYSYRVPTPGATVIEGAVHANTDLPGFTIRYTVNGEEPNAKSNVYTGPLKDRKRIALRAFSQTGRGGLTVRVDNR
ncbi:family 20 glycosylhydrolase [Arcticibacter sp.]|uniref:family 20 glycosylhydrolase n=1 Tax=Arcticibacter sp. TaxID=1872630 RepID=UPI003890EEE3